MGGKSGKEFQGVGVANKSNSAELTEEEIQLLLKNTHFNRKQIEEYDVYYY